MITGSTSLFRAMVGAFLCAQLAFPPALLAPPPPAWWTDRGAIDTTKTKDDDAAANLGQLKHFASKAYAELEAKLPGGAGLDLDALVAFWSLPPPDGVSRDDFAAVNVGQLKQVAKPFYDRLIAKGLATAYPWTVTTADDDDLALANLGQMKHVFSFAIPAEPDLDGDGLPDSWELEHLGTLAKSPNDSAGLPGGLTLRQAFDQGLIPTFYGDTPPTLTIVSGDNQGAEPGTPLAEPLVVLVTNSAGGVYQNVPLTYSTTGGGIAASSGAGALVASAEVRTNAQGEASAWAVTPNTAGPLQVTASTRDTAPLSGANPAAASSSFAGRASVSTSGLLSGYPAPATFEVKTATLGVQNPGIYDYHVPGNYGQIGTRLPPNTRWFLSETTLSNGKGKDVGVEPTPWMVYTGYYKSVETRYRITPAMRPPSFVGSSTFIDWLNDLSSTQAPDGTWSPYEVPYEPWGWPIGATVNIVTNTDSAFSESWMNILDEWEEKGDSSSKLEEEYPRDIFANDVIAALPPVAPPIFNYLSIASRFMERGGGGFTAGKAEYKLKVPSGALRKTYYWSEVWQPDDNPDTDNAYESQGAPEISAKQWAYDGQNPISPKFTIDPVSKSVNGHWSLFRLELNSPYAADDQSQGTDPSEGIRATNPTYFYSRGKLDLGNIYKDRSVPCLAVYYKDVIDPDFTVQSFYIKLVGFFPRTETLWTKAGGPDSGHLLDTGASVSYENPRVGGVYTFDETSYGQSTRTFLVLPPAGAEVKELIAADMVRANAFAAKVNAAYNPFGRNNPSNGLRWFYNNGAGDYLGRPDNAANRTVWRFNQVSQFGAGAVATWFGYPIRVGKMNNFLVGYAARKIGVISVNAWASQVLGTSNDIGADMSWNAGWTVAGGADYESTATAMAKAIWPTSDAKTRRLWPNLKLLDNHVLRSSPAALNFNIQFSSPGFLEMTSP